MESLPLYIQLGDICNYVALRMKVGKSSLPINLFNLKLHIFWCISSHYCLATYGDNLTGFDGFLYRQSGQRSRVRKLQYIAELERTVNVLQVIPLRDEILSLFNLCSLFRDSKQWCYPPCSASLRSMRCLKCQIMYTNGYTYTQHTHHLLIQST